MKAIQKNNRELLPRHFVVKQNSIEHPRWGEYLEFINNVGNGAWGGDSQDLSYGLRDMTAICIDSYEITDDVKVLDLDFVLELLEEEVVVEMVVDINGDSQELCQCVILSEYSRHAGEWALKSECTYSALDSGWGIDDEISTTSLGDAFFVDRIDAHDIVWSEFCGEYLSTNDSDTVYGYVGRYEDYFIRVDETVEVNGHYYIDDSALTYHDYSYSERQNEWVHSDDWETGYHDWEEDEDENSSADNAGYHDLTRKEKFDSSAKFTVGFEVEKEDSNMVSISYRDLYNRTSWIKERDGSLDDCTGYELVSPAFNLYDDGLDKDLEDDDIKRLINAKFSDSCGGHINIGSSIYTTEQMFEGISGFFPLFYSMYEHRLHKTYSKAKKKHEYYSKDKYSSIYIKSNVVEIRIPSSVINVTNLLWRRDLVRIMIDNFNKSEVQILRMLLNDKSKLHIHLRKVFTLEKLVEKIDKFVKYSEEFNNKKLSNANTSKLLDKKVLAA
jgi:hypothetical protein